MKDTPETVARIAASLSASGVDIVHPFHIEWWRDPAFPLPVVDGGTLGLLVGNTAALWSHVAPAVKSGAVDPVDRHVVRAVRTAVEALALPHAIVWAHECAPAFPMQRLAAAVGFAVVSPSQLAIAPRHGPWWSIRAAVLLRLRGPEGPRPSLTNPCATCEAPCVPPFERARNTMRWRRWLAVRDACPVGVDGRFADAQIAHHYRSAFSADD